MITIAGQLTADDYVAANRLHMQKRGWKRLAWILVWSFLALGALASGLIAIQDPRTGLPTFSILVVVALLNVFVRMVYLPRRARRVFSQQRNLHATFECRVTEAGLDSTNANTTTHLPWTYIIRWKEGPALFVLYQSDLVFNLVPKRLFAHAADVDAFRALVRRHVGAAA